jgi:hypothetical protein
MAQGHGGRDTIYATLKVECATKEWTLLELDLLIICGGFQVGSSLL